MNLDAIDRKSRSNSRDNSAASRPVNPINYNNKLLQLLDIQIQRQIASHLRGGLFAANEEIIKDHTVVTDMYFIESGIVSLISRTVAHANEVAMIGSEGLVGAVPVVLGVNRSLYAAVGAVPGRYLRIDTRSFMDIVGGSIALRRILLGYVETVVTQIAQTANAGAGHRIEARVARWILMCRDRVADDSLPVTHDYIGMILGVRRASVSNALHVLEGNGLIKGVRGAIVMVDRAGLQAAAGGCYGVPEDEYARIPALRPPVAAAEHATSDRRDEQPSG